MGAGITVTRYWKAGNVDYKKEVELKGVDLERYRGKAREEVRVSLGLFHPAPRCPMGHWWGTCRQ